MHCACRFLYRSYGSPAHFPAHDALLLPGSDAEAVAPVVHQRKGLDDRPSAELFSAFANDAGNGAADFAFPFHTLSVSFLTLSLCLSFRTEKKRTPPSRYRCCQQCLFPPLSAYSERFAGTQSFGSKNTVIIQISFLYQPIFAGFQSKTRTSAHAPTPEKTHLFA